MALQQLQSEQGIGIYLGGLDILELLEQLGRQGLGHKRLVLVGEFWYFGERQILEIGGILGIPGV